MSTGPSTVLDALTPSFMAGFLSGFISGIDRGREQADAEAEALFRRAAGIVHAHAKLDPHDLHAAKVRARQIASCEDQKRQARPWPEGADP